MKHKDIIENIIRNNATLIIADAKEELNRESGTDESECEREVITSMKHKAQTILDCLNHK